MVKSVWAGLGRGGRSRDTDIPASAPDRVSDAARAKSIDRKASHLVEFSRQKQDRLPERPNTSAGPASHAKIKTAEKRKTRDDLHFNPLALHGRETTFYNFPLPGSLPTPASSPRSFAASRHDSIVIVRTSTPESLIDEPAPKSPALPDPTRKMEVPHGQIGMALGSPSHAPAAWQQEYSVETYTRHESPDQMDSIDDTWDHHPKPKPSRWKMFGGIFGGGKKATPAFYQVQPEQSLSTGSEQVQEQEKRPKSRARDWSTSTKQKHNPELSRSNTTPAFDISGTRAAAGTPTPEIRVDGGPLTENASRFAQKGTGLLDVDIPSIRMERYSIMFSGVLQGPNSSSSSSLLARRQATLDKLKSVNEALALKEQEIEAKTKLMTRRATSPSAMETKSPGFSLFPGTPSRTRDRSPGSPSQPSGLQRSNTSPAALSPSRSSFAFGLDNEHPKEKGRAIPEKQRVAQDSRVIKVKTESGRPSTASPKASPWSPNKSHLALDNSDAEDDEVVEAPPVHISMKLKPQLVEADWQIINPTHSQKVPSVSGSATSQPSHSVSASTSSNGSMLGTGLPTKPNMPSPALTSSISPKGQAQAARARENTASSSRPPQTRSNTTPTTTTILPRVQPQPNPEAIDSPTLASEPTRSLNTSIIPSSTYQAQPNLKNKTQEEKKLKQEKEKEEAETQEEERLKSLADVSIARQISVSRQQRQLLIPIKTSGSLQRSPSSLKSSTSTPVNVSNTTSPLTAIATTAQRAASKPSVGPSRSEDKFKTPIAKERLLDSVKAVTPTVVIVGADKEKREEEWSSATRRLKAGDKIMGLGEKRRLLAARNEKEEAEKEMLTMQNRKSERVVVERVSVDS